MFAKSAILSLALLSVASPAFSAPLPTVSSAQIEARAIPAGLLTLLKSLGSGVLSGSAISGLLALLGGGLGGDAAATRRDLGLEDLSDDEFVTLLEWVGQQTDASGELEARGGVPSGIGALLKNLLLSLFKSKARRDLEDLEARGGVPAGIGAALKKLLLSLFKGAARRDLESLDARGGVPAGIGAALKKLLLSLFKGGRRDLAALEARGGVPAGIGAALKKLLLSLFGKAARRDVEDLNDEEITALAEWLAAQSDDDSDITARGFEDLSGEELNTLLEWVDTQVNGESKVTRSLNELD